MANIIIADNRLVTASGVTFTHSTETAGYEAENVQIYQPGESFRTSVLNPGWINCLSLGGSGAVQALDTVAALYTNVTAHPNLLQRSNQFSTTWTATNVTVAQNSNNFPIAGVGFGYSLTDDATNDQHSISQGWTAPASGPALNTAHEFVISYYVARAAGTLDVTLRLESSSTRYVECEFDLGAGTAGTVTQDGSGDWTVGTATITAVTPVKGSASWYRVTLSGTCPTAGLTTMTTRLMLTSGGSVVYVGSGDAIFAACATAELGSSASDWVLTTTDTGAIWCVRNLPALADGTDWMMATTRDLTGWPFVHLVHKFSAVQNSADCRISIFDPNNADSYIEIGNMVVARCFQPARNVATDWSLSWAEEGDSARALGGQLYRPVNKRYRVLDFNIDWLSEDEAFDDVSEIDRRVGRSEGTLAVIDPSSSHAHTWSVWGLQDALGAISSRSYSTTLSSTLHRRSWAILEALP